MSAKKKGKTEAETTEPPRPKTIAEMPPNALNPAVEVAKLSIELSRLNLDWLRLTNDPMKVFHQPENFIARAHALLNSAMASLYPREMEPREATVSFDRVFRSSGTTDDIPIKLADGRSHTFKGFTDRDLEGGRSFKALVKQTSQMLTAKLMATLSCMNEGRMLSDERREVELTRHDPQRRPFRETLVRLFSRPWDRGIEDALRQLWFKVNESTPGLLLASDVRELSQCIGSYPKPEVPATVEKDYQSWNVNISDALESWAKEVVAAIESDLPEVIDAAIKRHFQRDADIPIRWLALLAETRESERP